jgi:type I restriction-modification system DNA methylase subunit
MPKGKKAKAAEANGANGTKSPGGAQLGFEATLWQAADVLGFCKSATVEEIRQHGHVLTPGRYVGAEEVEDDGEPFEEKMKRLTEQLDGQFKESARLEKTIVKNLTGLGFWKDAK